MSSSLIHPQLLVNHIFTLLRCRPSPSNVYQMARRISNSLVASLLNTLNDRGNGFKINVKRDITACRGVARNIGAYVMRIDICCNVFHNSGA